MLQLQLSPSARHSTVMHITRYAFTKSAAAFMSGGCSSVPILVVMQQQQYDAWVACSLSAAQGG